MEVILKKIDSKFKNYIKEKYIKIKNILEKEQKKINYINIFHNSWTNSNDCDELIKHLKNQYLLDIDKLITLGFICAPINCDDQFFHIDYDGNTNTYFIPLIDIDEKNGTEYLEFDNKNYNIDILDKLKIVSNKYLLKNDIINELSKLDITPTNYKFKYLNSNKWSLIYLPYYCLHRGRKNIGYTNRVIFQMIFYKDNICKYNMPKELYYYDAEIDDEQKEKVLENRKIIN
jgi:hypothetical protein